MRDHVLIVGAGPAGRAAAAACAGAGLPVTLVAPAPGRPWRNVYGAWADELRGLDLGDVVACRYPRPLVRTDRVDALALGRAYVRLDNAALQESLRQRAARHGAVEVHGVARRVTHDRDGSVLQLVDGRRLAAGIVVDASGHRPALATPGRGPAPAWQVAYGLVGRFEPALVPAGGMWLMDWRLAPLAGHTQSTAGAPAGGRGSGGGDSASPPTFCYVLDLGKGRALVEETTLAARPPPPMVVLRAQLEARLRGLGVAAVETEAVERVRFPMGGPLPARGRRVVAFGAAGGMVHPATGYQVAAALRTAPALAAALASALAAPGAGPDDVAAAGREAVWPADRARQRALHAFGLEVLLGLDVQGLQRFFEAFFSLPAPQWHGYVSGAPSAAAVARTMLAVAARLPASLRLELVRAATGRGGARAVVDLVRAGR